MEDEYEDYDPSLSFTDNGTCLYVGDLSRGCSRSDVEQEFGKYAEVVHVKIMKHMGTSTPIGYGFVTLATHEGAVRCMEALNGVLLRGRKMRISWAQRKSISKEPRAERVTSSLSRERQSSGHINTKTSIHVSFETKKSNVLVDEVRLRDVFNIYGEVVDVSIKEIHEDKKYNLTHGFGFVHFHDTEDGITSALNAAKETKGKFIDHVVYTAEPSNNLLKQIPRHLQLLQSSGSGEESKLSDFDLFENNHHESPAISLRVPDNLATDALDLDDLILSETVTDVDEQADDGHDLVKSLLLRGAGLDDKAEINRLRKAVVRLNSEWQKRVRGGTQNVDYQRRKDEDRHHQQEDRGKPDVSKKRLEDQLRDVKGRWKDEVAQREQEFQRRLTEKEVVWKKEMQWIEERWSGKCREWCQGYEKLQTELRQQEELRDISIRQAEEIRTQLTKELQKRQREEERSASLLREKDEMQSRLQRAETELARLRSELLLPDSSNGSSRRQPQSNHSIDFVSVDDDNSRNILSSANLTPPGLYSYQSAMPAWLSGGGSSGGVSGDLTSFRTSTVTSSTGNTSTAITDFDDSMSYANLLRVTTSGGSAVLGAGHPSTSVTSSINNLAVITQASQLYQSFQGQLNNDSISTVTATTTTASTTASSGSVAAAISGGNGGGSGILSAHLKQQQQQHEWNLPFFDNLHREAGREGGW